MTDTRLQNPHMPLRDATDLQDPFAWARRLTTPIWVYDTDNNHVAYANEAACGVWEAKTEDELKARDLSDGMSTTVKKRLKQYQADFFRSDVKFSEVWTVYPNGVPHTLDVVFSGFVMPDGRMAMMCEATGEGKQEPKTLRSAEALLHTDVIIALVGLDGRALYMNPAARTALPHDVKHFRDIFVNHKNFQAMEKDWDKGGKARRVAKVQMSKGLRWLDFSIKRCLDAATGNQAILVTAVDVTDLKTARDKARYLADRDQLTGCYNRTYLQRYLERMSSKFEGKATAHALLIMDIDRFKQMNDTYGHDVGDKVLIAFVKQMKKRIGPYNMIVRLGGDEFLVFLKDIGTEENFIRHLDAISKKIRVPLESGQKELELTLSIGASTFQISPQTNWSEKMHEADIALYHSKTDGRNRCTVHDEELDARLLERKWLEIEIEKAISQKAFALHYQPRINLQTGQIVAAEALIRWKHPDRGFISPSEFIPICEDMGVIDDIGKFVFKRACNDLNQWQDLGININVSLNISPKQFQDIDVISKFKHIAQMAKFPISRMEVELTETSLAGDDTDIYAKMRAITELGFRFALDDFGTGYSNLVHISGFPVQCIKIDRTFVQKLPASGPLLNLIFALARQIGAATVAEGVETIEQLEWLRDHHCDEVQGFLFSKAVTAEDLLKILTSNVSCSYLPKRALNDKLPRLAQG